MVRPNGEEMSTSEADALQHLTDVESDCVRRYVSVLERRLGANLVEVRLFGSAARGDMWSRRSSFRSDIDLLILTREALSSQLQEELVNETYPLYLECGRQIGPQWRTLEQWRTPKDERARAFVASVEGEGLTLYRGRGSAARG